MTYSAIIDPQTTAYDKLCCAVIENAVIEYKKNVRRLWVFNKNYTKDMIINDEFLKLEYYGLIHDIKMSRKFFERPSIYWDYTDINGKWLLQNIDKKFKKELRETINNLLKGEYGKERK